MDLANNYQYNGKTSYQTSLDRLSSPLRIALKGRKVNCKDPTTIKVSDYSTLQKILSIASLIFILPLCLSGVALLLKQRTFKKPDLITTLAPAPIPIPIKKEPKDPTPAPIEKPKEIEKIFDEEQICSYFNEAGAGLTDQLYRHHFANRLEVFISEQELEIQDTWLKTREDNPDQLKNTLKSFLKISKRRSFEIDFDAIFNKLIENWIKNPKIISENSRFTSKSIVWLKLALDMVKIINFPIPKDKDNKNSDEREKLCKTTLKELSKLKESPFFAKFAAQYVSKPTLFESDGLTALYKLMIPFNLGSFELIGN